MKFTFSKKNRLTGKANFNNFFKQASCVRQTSFFRVLLAPSKKIKPRLGIIIAKRQIKLATTRNRLKRLIRESFRFNQKNFLGYDLIVIVKKNFDGIFKDPLGINNLCTKK